MVNRDYGVRLWISLDEECHTRIVRGLPNPSWNAKGTIFFKEYPNIHTFLNLEVLRLRSVNNSGTSNGVAIVGRARLPLPREFNCEKVVCFPLVRDNYKEEDTMLKATLLFAWNSIGESLTLKTKYFAKALDIKRLTYLTRS
ncbi:hypothetical protein SESBI_02773 [Sesbania bispinosa]|nr:hypothetical protein SESBI_02773 [Sesbania bispinosa]